MADVPNDDYEKAVKDAIRNTIDDINREKFIDKIKQEIFIQSMIKNLQHKWAVTA